jgi:Protein of unknown function (DUF998)
MEGPVARWYARTSGTTWRISTEQPGETTFRTCDIRAEAIDMDLAVKEVIQEGDNDMKISIAKPAATATEGPARWLALGAILGPVLFTLSWFVLGFLSPGYTLWGTRIAPYSPISQPVSGLGLGPTALYMNTAFVLSGLLLLAGVAGAFQGIQEMSAVARRTCAVLLALSPLGVVVDGFFTLETMMVHSVGFLLAAGTPVLSFLVTGLLLRRAPHWRRFGNWLLLGSPLTLVLVVLFFASFNPTASGAGLGVAGLTQRVLILEVHAWFVALGWLAFGRSSSTAGR